MDKLQAIDKILGETRLSALDKLLLIQMVKHSATDFICPLNRTQLGEYCGANRRSIKESMTRLESEGYLIVIPQEGHPDKFIPYPYSLHIIETREQGKSSRLTITPDQGSYLLGVLAEKEASLTLVAREAMTRRDLAEHRRACLQVDMILDLKDILGKFVARTSVAKAK